MNENLAHNLTASAQRYPDDAALRIEDVVITYAELDEATARVAGLLRERGLEPGDRVGIMLPNVPAVRVRLLRRPARGRRRRANERAAQAAGGRVLPRRPRSEGDLCLARVRRGRRAGSRRCRRRLHPGRARLVRPAAREGGAVRGGRRPHRRRHRGDPLHVRHHRQAEGRRADALEPRDQRRRQQGAVLARDTRT